MVLYDRVDLCVANISRGARACTRIGLRVATVAEQLAHWSRAAGISHAETSAVAGNANDDLRGADAGFGQHDQGGEGLCFVDMGPEAVTAFAAGNGPLVAHVCITG